MTQIVIINAPFGTNFVYQIMKRMLPMGLQDKASRILRGSIGRAMLVEPTLYRHALRAASFLCCLC
jgi:hypothetical protein